MSNLGSGSGEAVTKSLQYGLRPASTMARSFQHKCPPANGIGFNLSNNRVSVIEIPTRPSTFLQPEQSYLELEVTVELEVDLRELAGEQEVLRTPPAQMRPLYNGGDSYQHTFPNTFVHAVDTYGFAHNVPNEQGGSRLAPGAVPARESDREFLLEHQRVYVPLRVVRRDATRTCLAVGAIELLMVEPSRSRALSMRARPCT